MSAPLTLFRWTVPVGGVHLVADAEGCDAKLESPEWQALGDALVPQGDGRREIDPLVAGPEHLFEVLATASLEGDALAQVASTWGLLGLKPKLLTTATGRRQEKATLDRPVESVAQWRAELLRLRDAFELWGAVSALVDARVDGHRGRAERARVDLAERVEPRPGFVLLTNHHQGERRRIGEANSGTERLMLANPSDLLLAGRLALRATLDKQLDAHPTRLRPVYDDGMESLRLRAQPDSLLGAAWFQLAEAAAVGSKARSCLRCGRWFVVKSGRRGHDRYHHPKCRQAHQRLRAQARQLAAEGQSVRKVAGAVSQPAWLVREWIEGNARRKETKQ